MGNTAVLQIIFQKNLINKFPMRWFTDTKWMPINVNIERMAKLSAIRMKTL